MLEPSGGDPRGRVIAPDAEILAAVAAEQPAMVELLEELVAAPTLLGREAGGPGGDAAGVRGSSASSRSTSRSTRRRCAAHPGRRRSAGTSPARRTSLADWGRAATPRRALADPQRAHRRRQPRAGGAVERRPVRALVARASWLYGRGAGDMKAGLVAIVGAVRGLQRLGLAPRAPRPAPVGRRGGVHRQRRARVRAGRATPPTRRSSPSRRAARCGPRRSGVLWFQVRVLGAPAHAGDARRGRTRSRRRPP